MQAEREVKRAEWYEKMGRKRRRREVRGLEEEGKNNRKTSEGGGGENSKYLKPESRKDQGRSKSRNRKSTQESRTLTSLRPLPF